MNEAYVKLRNKFHMFPIGLPDTGDSLKLLRILYSEENAIVAAHLPNVPVLHSARRVARKAGVSRKEAAERLRDMAAKDLIFEKEILGEKRYGLMPIVPGMMEMQFMAGQEMTEERKKAGDIWHETARSEFGKEVHGYPTKGIRVIPIRKTVEAGQKIFSFEEVEKIIRDSGAVAVTDCACRKSAGKCDAPLEVCMMFGVMADYTAERGLARKITRKEAVEIIERANEAGLVHTTTNCKPPVSIICNCCSCCCESLAGVTRMAVPAASISSNFRSVFVEGNGCKACGMCVKACPMDAITFEEKQISINEDKCIGCGVCILKCRTESLKLERRTETRPFGSSLGLMTKLMEERGKTRDVLKSYIDDLL